MIPYVTHSLDGIKIVSACNNTVVCTVRIQFHSKGHWKAQTNKTTSSSSLKFALP